MGSARQVTRVRSVPRLGFTSGRDAEPVPLCSLDSLRPRSRSSCVACPSRTSFSCSSSRCQLRPIARLAWEGNVVRCFVSCAPPSAWRAGSRSLGAVARQEREPRRLAAPLDSTGLVVNRQRERLQRRIHSRSLLRRPGTLPPFSTSSPLHFTSLHSGALLLETTSVPVSGRYGHRSRRARARAQRRRRLRTRDCFDSRRQAGRRVATRRRGMSTHSLSFTGHSN